MDTIADEDLMSRYSDGHVDSFNTLYHRHKNSMFRFMLRQCRCPESQAEELFQDVWMRAINAAAHYKPVAKFTTWLYRIAHHRLIDYYRQQGRIYQTISVNNSDAAIPEHDMQELTARQPESIAENHESIEILMNTVSQLPIEQREIFLLKYEAGATLTEITEITGSPLETVKSRLRYAQHKVRSGYDNR